MKLRFRAARWQAIPQFIIPVSDKTEMKRYAPDSIKFADAKPSTFTELKVGDQLRALGERTPDGTHFNPEKVVTGSFRTVGGVVTAVDPATGEIKINELEKKKPLTIVIKHDSVLRRFPPASEMGAMMGGFNRGGEAARRVVELLHKGGQAQAPRPQGGPGGPGGPGGRGGFNINDMLEKLPTISVADVKVGDTIIVSSTQGVDPTRLTAIALVSGADHSVNHAGAEDHKLANKLLIRHPAWVAAASRLESVCLNVNKQRAPGPASGALMITHSGQFSPKA
jgi:hypothetical protein